MKHLIKKLLAKPTLLWRNVKPTHAAIDALLVYRQHGQWVFDDERNGLQAEAFVCGMSEIIDSILIGNDIKPSSVHDGFRLTFSPFEFPNTTHTLEWLRKEGSGNMYYCTQTEQEGWLCPALMLYFNSAPPKLYARADVVAASERKHRRMSFEALEGACQYDLDSDEDYRVEDYGGGQHEEQFL